MVAGNGLLVPPHSGSGEDDAANATGCLLVFGPLRTDLEMVGLVEIFQRPDVAVEVQQGYLRFLLQMCELATDFLKSHQLRHFSDRQVLWARLEDFTRGVHASLDPREAAYTIANEARRLIECDRVSVALRKGNRCTIEAVSGQDVFDKRSNTVRLLGRLASAVVATGEPVWYAGDTRDLAPQVEDAVQEYVDDAHSKMIAVLPLGRAQARPRGRRGREGKHRRAGGALIVEQIEDNRVAPAMAQRIDVVCKHSSIALANAMEHQNLFLMPLVAGDRQEPVPRAGPHAAQDGARRDRACWRCSSACFSCRPTSTCTPKARWSRSIARTSTPTWTARSPSWHGHRRQADRHGSWVKKGQLLVRTPQSQAQNWRRPTNRRRDRVRATAPR